MGFDFIVMAPLLPSHCGFSFVFGCGVSFLVSSSVFLSMIVQQLVVIPVFSQEGVRACPSTLPSWTSLLKKLLNDPFLHHTPKFSFFNLFIFGCIVSLLLRGLSLVAASGGYSLLQCAGFSLRWLVLLRSTGSRCVGFNSCGTWAQLLWHTGSVVVACGL